jgi:antitoxin MazE
MKIAAKSHLAKWGNSLAVRLPSHIVESARLREGDPVNLSVGKDGAVVIQPARRKYRLEELVSGISPKNRHDETDWGNPVGKEMHRFSPKSLPGSPSN